MGEYFPEKFLLTNSCGGNFVSTNNLFLFLEMETYLKATMRKETALFIQINVFNPLTKKKKLEEISKTMYQKKKKEKY